MNNCCLRSNKIEIKMKRELKEDNEMEITNKNKLVGQPPNLIVSSTTTQHASDLKSDLKHNPFTWVFSTWTWTKWNIIPEEVEKEEGEEEEKVGEEEEEEEVKWTLGFLSFGFHNELQTSADCHLRQWFMYSNYCLSFCCVCQCGEEGWGGGGGAGVTCDCRRCRQTRRRRRRSSVDVFLSSVYAYVHVYVYVCKWHWPLC